MKSVLVRVFTRKKCDFFPGTTSLRFALAAEAVPDDDDKMIFNCSGCASRRRATATAAGFSHADYIARDEALNKSLDKSTIKYVPSGLRRDRGNYLSRLITRSY